MRTLRLVTMLAALATLPACSEPLQPSAESATPGGARFDGGLYMGTGHAFEPDDVSETSSDTTAVDRGSGYFGNGN